MVVKMFSFTMIHCSGKLSLTSSVIFRDLLIMAFCGFPNSSYLQPQWPLCYIVHLPATNDWLRN